MSGNTLFITYILKKSGLVAGYSQAIHCNYIKKIDLGVTNPYMQEISLNFTNSDDFKFLASRFSETGYTANQIYGVVQIVDNTPFYNVEDIKPDSTSWRLINLTDQIPPTWSSSIFTVNNNVSEIQPFAGRPPSMVELSPTNLTSVVFKIPLMDYTGSTFTQYNLEYLNYPESTNPNKLVFGDVTYFFGNVETEIKADIYTTDINIELLQYEFNSTTNKTWNGLETVYISEIGIYDTNNNLVAIGKLNNPVAKDDSIARTIVFALDF